MDNNDVFTTQFKAFYIQHAKELIFFARKFVDHDTAEDIVHTVFLKIWDKRSTVVAEKGIKTYLLSMVQNACYDYLKRQIVEDNYLARAAREIKLDELNYYMSSKEDSDNDKIETLYAAIEQLPEKCKEIFKKAYLDEQPHADIAKEMGISVRTVETHVYKALKFLREKLISTPSNDSRPS